MIIRNFLLVACLGIAVKGSAQSFTWSDTALSTESRVEHLIDALNTEEKISLLMYNNPEIKRLNIPAYNWWNEALHGVARNGNATVFPQSINLAATFDDSLIYEVASFIATEARAKYNIARKSGNFGQYAGLTFWSPNINIFRDPRWGRGQETYGEDPYLTSRMGVGFVHGLQGNDPQHPKAAACAKHYAVHSGPESQRHVFNAKPSARDFNETYLPAFSALVKEAGVAGVMCAYNRLYDLPCCASDTLLRSILREKWGFTGYIVSDCAAISDIYYHHKTVNSQAEAAAMSLNAGVNLDCGDEYEHLQRALKENLITEDTIDEALKPLLNLRIRLGNLDPIGTNPLDDLDESDIRSEQAIAAACNAAAKSIVLLKNEGVLPLTKENLKSVSLLGPLANNELVLLGNYSGMSPSLITIKAGMISAIDSAIALNVNDAFELMGQSSNYEEIINEVKNSDIIVVALGLNSSMQGENGDAPFSNDGGDYLSLELPPSQIEFLRQLRNATTKPIIALVFSGSPLLIEEAVSLCDGMLWCGYPGEQGGKAITELLFGQRNPSGRLPFTIPKSIEQLPPFEDYSMKNRTYRFMESEPLFPFGYGLSYAHFSYSDIKISTDQLNGQYTADLSLSITNTSKTDGDEIVQVYLRKAHPHPGDPYNHLIAFRSVHVKAAEKIKLSIPIPPDAFLSYRETGKPYTEKGQYILGFVSMRRDDNSDLRALEQPIVIR